MSAILFSLVAFGSTLCGGLFALRWQRQLPYILSFSAGIILGVVSFDILPELFELAASHGIDPIGGMTAMVAGFLLFHAAEKGLLLRHVGGDGGTQRHHPRLGFMSACALAGHSLMDGVGIGLGFQVSAAVGIAVAIAVVTHDFCDGLNTVSLMLVHRNSDRNSVKMLLLDALAPVLGAASTLAFSVPPALLVPYLGFFAGFLLYIAAVGILPRVHTLVEFPNAVILTVLTAAGACVTFIAIAATG